MAQVTIIGLGLIGGSLALALKKYTKYTVVGYDSCQQTIAQALEEGAIDKGASCVQQAVADGDFIFLAVNPSLVVEIVGQTAAAMKTGAVITEVASAKGVIPSELNRLLPPGVSYVGGHPMAGSEKNGFGAAAADLFVGKPYIILRDGPTGTAAADLLAGLVAKLGARICIMDMNDHDPAVADISHVPHIAAAALTVLAGDGTNGQRKLSLAAGGFRDMTRVASGNPEMWADICLMNRAAVQTSLEQLQHILTCVNHLLAANDKAALTEFLAQAKHTRDSYGTSQHVQGGMEVENTGNLFPPQGIRNRSGR